MKKLFALLLVLVLALSFVACQKAEAPAEAPAETEEPAAEEAAGPARVAFICKGYNDTYCLLVMNIFKAYAEENYADLYTVDYYDGECDADKITTLIETCTASEYDVIIMQQQDPDANAIPVIAAEEAGVRVINTVGKVNDEGKSVYLDCDPVEQGTIVAQYLADQGILKEGTKCGLLQGPAGQFHSESRTQGYETVCAAVGAEIVAKEICEWQKDLAQTCVENWLVAFPEIEVILACNDDMALGTLEAMKLAGRDDITVIGVDANEEGCLALKAGTLYASVAQDTFGYAEGAADYAAAIINGETVESKLCPSVLITPDKADEILLTVHGYTQEQIDALN